MASEWGGDNGVAYVECAVFYEVGYMGCFTVLGQGETMLFGMVLDIHDSCFFEVSFL